MSDEVPYWYCCGSLDPMHEGGSGRKCRYVPQWFRHFATKSEHSLRDRRAFAQQNEDIARGGEQQNCVEGK